MESCEKLDQVERGMGEEKRKWKRRARRGVWATSNELRCLRKEQVWRFRLEDSGFLNFRELVWLVYVLYRALVFDLLKKFLGGLWTDSNIKETFDVKLIVFLFLIC